MLCTFMTYAITTVTLRDSPAKLLLKLMRFEDFNIKQGVIRKIATMTFISETKVALVMFLEMTTIKLNN